jgi:hypothetical protein
VGVLIATVGALAEQISVSIALFAGIKVKVVIVFINNAIAFAQLYSFQLGEKGENRTPVLRFAGARLNHSATNSKSHSYLA